MRFSFLALLALTSCTSKSEGEASPGTFLSDDDLRNPENCASCHREHYREWSGSMHAYAAEDPIFLAMNRRAQRETNGAVGDLCVRCHAPLAVAAGVTKDGQDLPNIPKPLRGVTCYVCHTTTRIEALHNNALVRQKDYTMRGGIGDPAPNQAHEARYSVLFDRGRPESSTLCGSCHDVRLPSGLDVERTFAEYQTSVYAKPGPVFQSCGGCHLPERQGFAATVQGAPPRVVHNHSMAGVDIALSPFPEAETQRKLVQSLLDTSLRATLCVSGGTARVSLTATFVGHAFPSGATHDRRAWVEISAFSAGTAVFSSGHRKGGAIVKLDDPNLVLFREKLFDASGKEIHFLWGATRSEPTQLRVPVTSPNEPFQKSFALPAGVDKVAMRVLFQPFGNDVVDDLVASGDLDPAVAQKIPEFALGSTALEWKAAGPECVP